MKRTQILVAFLITLMVAGCQEVPSSVVESPARTLDFTVLVNDPEVFTNETAPLEVLKARAQANTAAMHTFYRLIARETDNWREAHEEVQRELAASVESERFVREQTSAILMLKTYLLGEDANADKLDAIGYYTNLLIEHKNPEGPLLADALQRLQGHWSKEEVATAASQAMVGPEAFLARRLERMSKHIGTDLRATDDLFLNEAEHALAQLREMSQQ